MRRRSLNIHKTYARTKYDETLHNCANENDFIILSKPLKVYLAIYHEFFFLYRKIQ